MFLAVLSRNAFPRTASHGGRRELGKASCKTCVKSGFKHVSFVPPVKNTRTQPSHKPLENRSLHTPGGGLQVWQLPDVSSAQRVLCSVAAGTRLEVSARALLHTCWHRHRDTSSATFISLTQNREEEASWP